MRKAASLLVGLIAAFFLLLGVSTPLTLSRQVTQNRTYYRQFGDAERYVDTALAETGKLPSDEQLQAWAVARGAGAPFNSVTLSPVGCADGFTKSAGDRFLIGFRRGERTECFASRSKRSTLPLSLGFYLRSRLGIGLILYWVLAIAEGWAAWRLWPRAYRARKTGSRAPFY